MKKNSLLVVRKRERDIKHKIICFHHAGGGASSFYTWTKLLGDDIEVAIVQLPGREERIEDAFYNDINKAILDIASICKEYIGNSDYSIFGHSMGGILGYEVEKRLENKYGLEAKTCFLSSCKIWKMTSLFDKKVDELSDDEFLKSISRYGGIDKEFFRMEEFKKIYTKILRSDFKLLEEYKCTDPLNIKSPIVFMYGEEDKTLKDVEIRTWENISNKGCTFKKFQGNHFYLIEHRKEVCSEVLEHINSFY